MPSSDKTTKDKTKKNKTTDELLDDAREAVKQGVDNTLAFADKLVADDPPTAKEMATETYEVLRKNASVTLDFYKSAYKAFFPKKK